MQGMPRDGTYEGTVRRISLFCAFSWRGEEGVDERDGSEDVDVDFAGYLSPCTYVENAGSLWTIMCADTFQMRYAGCCRPAKTS